MDLISLKKRIESVPSVHSISQFGEHLILKEIASEIPEIPKFILDIGAGFNGNGLLSNSYEFIEKLGWDGLLLDANKGGYDRIKEHFVTPDNIIGILRQYDVPQHIGILSVDIDSFDLDVMEAIMPHYSPAIICAEYNGCLPPETTVKLKYEQGYTWDGTTKYGYSYGAGLKFAEKWGYYVIMNHINMNLFMVKSNLIPEHQKEAKPPLGYQQFYHPYNPDAVWEEY